MVKYIFEYANKYNLNIQILWFGSDVCGSSEFTPAYIRNDVETYSLLGDTSNLDYSDKHLIYREKN